MRTVADLWSRFEAFHDGTDPLWTRDFLHAWLMERYPDYMHATTKEADRIAGLAYDAALAECQQCQERR